MSLEIGTDLADGTAAAEVPGLRPASTPPRLPEASPPAFAVPHRPTLGELAALLRELFHEGTLSWEQMSSLANLPELQPLLAGLLSATPPHRRPMAAE